MYIPVLTCDYSRRTSRPFFESLVHVNIWGLGAERLETEALINPSGVAQRWLWRQMERSRSASYFWNSSRDNFGCRAANCFLPRLCIILVIQLRQQPVVLRKCAALLRRSSSDPGSASHLDLATQSRGLPAAIFTMPFLVHFGM